MDSEKQPLTEEEVLNKVRLMSQVLMRLESELCMNRAHSRQPLSRFQATSFQHDSAAETWAS